MPPRRALVAAIAVLCSSVAPAAASAAGSPLAAAGLQPGARGLVQRPREIVYTGDSSAFVAGRGGSARHPASLHWTAWAAAQASAPASDWHDNCRPDCASGSFRAYQAVLRLSRPAMLGGHLVFTRMTVTYTGARPPYPANRSGSWTASLRYSAKPDATYFWYF